MDQVRSSELKLPATTSITQVLDIMRFIYLYTFLLSYILTNIRFFLRCKIPMCHYYVLLGGVIYDCVTFPL